MLRYVPLILEIVDLHGRLIRGLCDDRIPVLRPEYQRNYNDAGISESVAGENKQKRIPSEWKWAGF